VTKTQFIINVIGVILGGVCLIAIQIIDMIQRRAP